MCFFWDVFNFSLWMSWVGGLGLEVLGLVGVVRELLDLKKNFICLERQDFVTFYTNIDFYSIGHSIEEFVCVDMMIKIS